MADPRTERNAVLGATLVKKLQARAFDAYYCATKEEALQQALALIPKGDVISWGGSVSIAEIGLLDYVRKNFKCIDRDTAKTPEERMEIMRKGLLCDTFLMSTNAMTTDGELVNIDGNGNRCAAMIYGPKQVIVIAGLNKVTGNLHASTGVCANCNVADTICNYIVVTRRSKPAKKIKVILVGEDIGF